jgi:hypothetical protein
MKLSGPALNPIPSWYRSMDEWRLIKNLKPLLDID